MPSPQDPTVGLCLGSQGGPRGVGVFLWGRYPCHAGLELRLQAGDFFGGGVALPRFQSHVFKVEGQFPFWVLAQVLSGSRMYDLVRRAHTRNHTHTHTHTHMYTHKAKVSMEGGACRRLPLALRS